MTNVTIQECAWADVKHIPATYETGYAVFAKRKKPEIWFKAMLDEKIVGCGCVLLLSKATARLSNLFVVPEHRGKGIAQEIIRTREQYARDNGFKTIDVRTVKSFYRDHGYKELRTYKVGGSWFRKDLQ